MNIINITSQNQLKSFIKEFIKDPSLAISFKNIGFKIDLPEFLGQDILYFQAFSKSLNKKDKSESLWLKQNKDFIRKQLCLKFENNIISIKDLKNNSTIILSENLSFKLSKDQKRENIQTFLNFINSETLYSTDIDIYTPNEILKIKEKNNNLYSIFLND